MWAAGSNALATTEGLGGAEGSATGAPKKNNSKTLLTNFLQRFIGRTLTTGDVVYTAQSVTEGVFSATCKLVCYQGLDFHGEVRSTEKEAEQAAAETVLEAFAAERAALPPVVPRPKKPRTERTERAEHSELGLNLSFGKGEGRSAGKGAGKGAVKNLAPMSSQPVQGFAPPGYAEPKEGKFPINQEGNWKTILAMALQAHLKRAMTKDDVTYEYNRQGNQVQATVILNCLDRIGFNGEVCETDKDAERSACEQAMRSEYQFAVEAPPLPGPRAAEEKRKRKPKQQTSLPVGRAGPPAMGPLAVSRPQPQLGMQPHFAPLSPMAPASERVEVVKMPDCSNPKTELTIFLQGYAKKTLTKESVIYETVSDSATGAYLSTVTLACLEGQQVLGEPCPEPKLAEASAAREVLKMFAEEVQNVEAFKRKAAIETGQLQLGPQHQGLPGAPPPPLGQHPMMDMPAAKRARMGAAYPHAAMGLAGQAPKRRTRGGVRNRRGPE